MAHDANAYVQVAKKQMGEAFSEIVDKLATGLRRLGEPPYDFALPALMTLVRAP